MPVLMFLYLFRNFLKHLTLLFVFSLCCASAYACNILVQSNDVLANVVIDDKVIGVVPQKVVCETDPLLLKVYSRTGQVFTRTFPARSQFVPSLHSEWNVTFASDLDGESQSSNVVVESFQDDSKTSKLFKNQQWIIQELAQVKAQLQSVEQKKLAQQNSGRSVSSIGQSRKLDGVYLRLHSFRESHWDLNSISEEVSAVGGRQSNQRIQFCLKNEKIGNQWTRVYWGPFKNTEQAKKFSRKIKRQTVLVTNPDCQIN